MQQRQPDEKNLTNGDRITLWISDHLRFIRMAVLATGLVVFFIILPSSMRIVLWVGLQSHRLLASMLLAFSLLGISLIWKTGQKLDAWAFLVFNLRGRRPYWLDRIMIGFTQLGSGITALVIALALFISGNIFLAYEQILGTLTLWLVVEFLKIMVHRSRPFIRVTQARIVGFKAIGRSFPSGHTSQAFFIATLMSQHYGSTVWIVLLLYGTALIVGITRMYVGAHYPRDVLAGAVLGSAWGLLGVMMAGYMLTGVG
jgi:membrane-associated phospholipid phosphatase